MCVCLFRGLEYSYRFLFEDLCNKDFKIISRCRIGKFMVVLSNFICFLFMYDWIVIVYFFFFIYYEYLYD